MKLAIPHTAGPRKPQCFHRTLPSHKCSSTKRSATVWRSTRFAHMQNSGNAMRANLRPPATLHFGASGGRSRLFSAISSHGLGFNGHGNVIHVPMVVPSVLLCIIRRACAHEAPPPRCVAIAPARARAATQMDPAPALPSSAGGDARRGPPGAGAGPLEEPAPGPSPSDGARRPSPAPEPAPADDKGRVRPAAGGARASQWRGACASAFTVGDDSLPFGAPVADIHKAVPPHLVEALLSERRPDLADPPIRATLQRWIEAQDGWVAGALQPPPSPLPAAATAAPPTPRGATVKPPPPVPMAGLQLPDAACRLPGARMLPHAAPRRVRRLDGPRRRTPSPQRNASYPQSPRAPVALGRRRHRRQAPPRCASLGATPFVAWLGAGR